MASIRAGEGLSLEEALALSPTDETGASGVGRNRLTSCYPRFAVSMDSDESGFEYDANVAPHPERWLALDEGDRLAAIDASHHTVDESTERRASLHNGIHCIVENQIALGNPPATAETLERLTRDGLSRHDAIHAIGTVVAELLTNAAGAYDEEAYVRKLQRLTVNK